MLPLTSPGSSQTFCQEGDDAKKHDTATCLPGCSSSFASSRFHLQRSVLDRRLLSYSLQVRLELHTALGALPRAASGKFWVQPGASRPVQLKQKFGSKDKAYYHPVLPLERKLEKHPKNWSRSYFTLFFPEGIRVFISRLFLYSWIWYNSDIIEIFYYLQVWYRMCR